MTEDDLDIASAISSCASDRGVRMLVTELARFHTRFCRAFGSLGSGALLD
jgi:hypothetical protein